MSIFYPNQRVRRVTDITPALLTSLNIQGLIVDIDNTLTHHDSQQITLEVRKWLEETGKTYPIILLSNNNEERVRPFANMLGLDYIADGRKPLPRKGFARAGRLLQLPMEQIGVVGDQLFTDILGGNLAGAQTIHVEPMHEEDTVFFRIKRFFERRVMKGYHSKTRER